MPVQRSKAKPRHDQQQLVDALARELAHPSVAGPGVPDIIEEEQIYGDRLHVTVVWDRWTGVPHEQRGAVVLDAYERARGSDEAIRITVVLGLTPEEYEEFKNE